MFDLSAPIVTMFLVYVAAMIGTGVWAYARTQTFTDSALGGRRLSAPVAALSAGVGDMSWLFLSLPGAVYAAGVRAVVSLLGWGWATSASRTSWPASTASAASVPPPRPAGSARCGSSY